MTIYITPRAFGKIAAEGFRYGFDVSAYLVRRTLNELPPPHPIPAAVLPTQHPAATTTTPAPEPEPESVEDYLAGMRLR